MAIVNKTLKTVSGDIIYPETTSSQIVDFNTAVNSLITSADISGQVSTAISSAIDGIIDGAPTTFDTLKEISDYISTHGTEYSDLVTSLGTKVPKSYTGTVTFNNVGYTYENNINISHTSNVGPDLEIINTNYQTANSSNYNSAFLRLGYHTNGYQAARFILGSIDSNSRAVRIVGSNEKIYYDTSTLAGKPNAGRELVVKDDIANFITSSALSGYALSSAIPTKVSDLTNDSGFLTTNDVNPSFQYLENLIPTNTNQLTNGAGFITDSYHDSTKQDVLTAGVGISIVNNVISSTLSGVQYTVVSELPSSGLTGVIYLMAKTGSNNDVYDEYIYVSNGFEKIGSTAVDLSNYTQKELTGTYGKALIFNESDGGGAKFEHNDGTWSGIAVNDGGASGIAAQIYAINKNNTSEGVKLNVEKGKITYIKNKATAARTASDELAVKGDFAGYATQTWVGQQGYLTSTSAASTYATKSELGDIETILQSLVTLSNNE